MVLQGKAPSMLKAQRLGVLLLGCQVYECWTGALPDSSCAGECIAGVRNMALIWPTGLTLH